MKQGVLATKPRRVVLVQIIKTYGASCFYSVRQLLYHQMQTHKTVGVTAQVKLTLSLSRLHGCEVRFLSILDLGNMWKRAVILKLRLSCLRELKHLSIEEKDKEAPELFWTKRLIQEP
jgi:hypothetical protein